jgi:hypothetical protein
MAEDLVNHRRVFDGGNDLQGAAAVRERSMSMSKTHLSSRAHVMRGEGLCA